MGKGYLKIVKQNKKYTYKEEENKPFKPNKEFSISQNTKEDDLPF